VSQSIIDAIRIASMCPDGEDLIAWIHDLPRLASEQAMTIERLTAERDAARDIVIAMTMSRIAGDVDCPDGCQYDCGDGACEVHSPHAWMTLRLV